MIPDLKEPRRLILVGWVKMASSIIILKEDPFAIARVFPRA